MSWRETDCGETVHETGCRLVERGLRDGDRIIAMVWPKGAETELRRDHRGHWLHPMLPDSQVGGFSTPQAAANDLLDRVLARGVHAGVGP